MGTHIQHILHINAARLVSRFELPVGYELRIGWFQRSDAGREGAGTEKSAWVSPAQGLGRMVCCMCLQAGQASSRADKHSRTWLVRGLRAGSFDQEHCCAVACCAIVLLLLLLLVMMMCCYCARSLTGTHRLPRSLQCYPVPAKQT